MSKVSSESLAGIVWGRVSTIVGLVVPICAVVLLAEAFAPPSFRRFLVTMLINVVLVVGFYVFSGNSGLISFGHIGFAAMGAYVVALLTIPAIMKQVLLPSLPAVISRTTIPSTFAILVGAIGVGAFAATVGYPIVRLRGVGPGIATLALLQVIHIVIQNWKTVTMGDSTLTGIPIDTTLPVALGWTVVVISVAYLYQSSRSGRRLRASREDMEAARSVGIRVPWERFKALILSAAIMAVGGGLYAQYLGSMSPKMLYLSLGFLGVLMAVVGGINSLTGAVTGAVVVSVMLEGLRRATQGISIGSLGIKGIPGLQEVVLAILLLIILIRMPAGLTRGRELNPAAVVTLLKKRRGVKSSPVSDSADGGATVGEGDS